MMRYHQLVFLLLVIIHHQCSFGSSSSASEACNSSSTLLVSESVVVSIPTDDVAIEFKLLSFSLNLVQNVSMSFNSMYVLSLENVNVDVLTVFIKNETSISIRLWNVQDGNFFSTNSVLSSGGNTTNITYQVFQDMRNGTIMNYEQGCVYVRQGEYDFLATTTTTETISTTEEIEDDDDDNDPNVPAWKIECGEVVTDIYWVGDLVCDNNLPGYNTQVCNYDNGDCCPQTNAKCNENPIKPCVCNDPQFKPTTNVNITISSDELWLPLTVSRWIQTLDSPNNFDEGISGVYVEKSSGKEGIAIGFTDGDESRFSCGSVAFDAETMYPGYIPPSFECGNRDIVMIPFDTLTGELVSWDGSTFTHSFLSKP